MLALGELSAGQLGIEGAERPASGELSAGQRGIEGTERLALCVLSAGQLGVKGTCLPLKSSKRRAAGH